MTGSDHFLEIRKLTVNFSRWGQKVKALNSVDLRIPHGQWVILVGPNGSGKSTLLRAISGRVEPDDGEVLINGRSVHEMSPTNLTNSVFHVHQDPLLGTAPMLTLFENLAVADHEAEADHEPKRMLLKKYEHLLRAIGLNNRMKQPVKTLSGGERQLVALLIARLRPSSIVLLDEPLAALDPAKVDLCLNEITELKRRGRTLVQVTHDEDYAVSLGDRTVALRDGRVVYDEIKDSRSKALLQSHWNKAITIGQINVGT